MQLQIIKCADAFFETTIIVHGFFPEIEMRNAESQLTMINKGFLSDGVKVSSTTRVTPPFKPTHAAPTLNTSDADAAMTVHFYCQWPGAFSILFSAH